MELKYECKDNTIIRMYKIVCREKLGGVQVYAQIMCLESIGRQNTVNK